MSIPLHKEWFKAVVRSILWFPFLLLSLFLYSILMLFFIVWIFAEGIISNFEKADFDLLEHSLKPENIFTGIDFKRMQGEASSFAVLSQTQILRFTNSRDIEWKMNFTIWGFIVSITAACISANLYPNIWVSLSVALPVVLFHYIWLSKMQRSQDIDQFFFRAYRYAAEQASFGKSIFNADLVPFENWPIPMPWLLARKKLSSSFFWVLGDTLITILLFAVCVIFLLIKSHN